MIIYKLNLVHQFYSYCTAKHWNKFISCMSVLLVLLLTWNWLSLQGLALGLSQYLCWYSSPSQPPLFSLPHLRCTGFRRKQERRSPSSKVWIYNILDSNIQKGMVTKKLIPLKYSLCQRLCSWPIVIPIFIKTFV